MAATRVSGLFDKHTATIANGAAVSTIVRSSGATLVAIKMPAAWTAAAIAFEGTFDDGTTYQPVFDDANAEVTIAAATTAARIGQILVPTAGIMAKLAALPAFRIISGVAGLNVNQGAARDIIVITKA